MAALKNTAPLLSSQKKEWHITYLQTGIETYPFFIPKICNNITRTQEKYTAIAKIYPYKNNFICKNGMQGWSIVQDKKQRNFLLMDDNNADLSHYLISQCKIKSSRILKNLTGVPGQALLSLFSSIYAIQWGG